MTAATLDLSVLADGQLDNHRAPLRQLADAVAALWSAGTGLALQPAAVALEDAHARVVLAEPWSRGEEAPPAGLQRMPAASRIAGAAKVADLHPQAQPLGVQPVAKRRSSEPIEPWSAMELVDAVRPFLVRRQKALRHFALPLGNFTVFIVDSAARKSTPGRWITPAQRPLTVRGRREPLPRTPGGLTGTRSGPLPRS